MNFTQRFRKILTVFSLIFVLATTAACSSVQAKQPNIPTVSQSRNYAQLERGNLAVGQQYGDWVVSTAKGLIKDAYVRDNNKLGVVITPQVSPTDVKPLAKSLVQGFHKSFPNRDLNVLVYAPDKKLILTAQYDTQSNRVEYK